MTTTNRIGKALLVSAFFLCAPGIFFATARADEARVARVLDGDSMRLVDGRELRLIGVNAPEYGKDGRPDEPLARDARALLARLVADKGLRLEYGRERRDHYGRVLAHAFLDDGACVEESLLRAGLAVTIAIPPNLSRLNAYLRAEAEARRAGRGIWSEPYFKPRDAATLGVNDGGFRFVEGSVQRVGRGAHVIYLDLGDRFTIVVPTRYWHYFGGNPRRLLGKRLVARGWITAHRHHLQMRLSHPAMVEMVN